MAERNINKAFESSMAEGKFHERKGDYPNALKSYSNAVKLNATDSNAHYCKSQMLSKLGFRNEAVAELDIAIALNPKTPMFRVIKGLSLVTSAIEKIGDIPSDAITEEKLIECAVSEASKEFNEAVKLDPECAAAHMAKWSMLSIV